MIHPLPQTTDHVEGVQVPDLKHVQLRVAEECFFASVAGEYRKAADLRKLAFKLRNGTNERPLLEIMRDL